MKSRTKLIAAALACVLLLVGCSTLKDLRDNNAALTEDRLQRFGRVIEDVELRGPMVAVLLGDADGSEVLNYWIIPHDGEFEVWLDKARDGWLFVFVDSNRDLTLQRDEWFGWAEAGRPVDRTGSVDDMVEIRISAPATAHTPPPAALLDASLLEKPKLKYLVVGEVAALDEERFSAASSMDGLLQSYKAIRSGSSGLFMLEPYDENRIPVVLVHGIAGYPAQFEPLIEAIDRERYQVWFFNYASGFFLTTAGNSLFSAMEQLQQAYGFESAHIVAHSMGGLVSRWYLRNCASHCGYLRSFTTIASPLGGVESAALGVRYAPELYQIPAWRDLQPGSFLLERLFDRALPGAARYYLLFTYRNDLSIGDLFSTKSSDGVIAMSSQLRREAQNEAERLVGFDQTHTSVLRDPELIISVVNILDSN